MGSVGVSAVRLIDGSGDPLDDDSGKLNVNATLVAGATIDIGDVDMFLDGGTAIVGGNGAATPGTLRVTIASDTTGVLSVDDNGSTLSIDDGGGTITVDGTVDLGSTDNAVLDAIAASLEVLDDWDDSNYANVNLNITGTDVDGNSGNKSAQSQRIVIATDDVNMSAIKTAVEIIDNAISGSEMQVDVVAALPAGTNAIGKLAANSGVDIGDVDVTSISAGTNAIGKVGHDITGMVADGNAAISDTTAEQLDGSTSGLDVACKRVDLMAHPSNTGYIWVGDSGVTTNGSGGGIRLAAGDFYSIDVNNLNDIWFIATVDEENIICNYFT